MMEERLYTCQKCRDVFKLSTPNEVKCPRCGSTAVDVLPAWAPAGFEAGSPMWEYQCQECHHSFKRPIPSSPTEEKEIRCPECGAGHIHRLTAIGGQPLYCG